MFTSYQFLLYRQIIDLSSWSDTAGTSNYLPLGNECRLYFLFKSSLFKVASLISAAQTLSLTISFLQNSKQIIIMNISLDSCSTESDVFYVEQTSTEGSSIPCEGNNTPAILNSTEISGAMEREVITISSVASPEPPIVTLDSDSNDPTMAYGFGNQQPIVPPSPNDLNLPPNLFNVLATMAVIRVDDEYSPQSPEPTIPSPISTPPMNFSTIEGWTQRIPRLTMTHFIQMMSTEESTGIFRRANPSTLTSQ